MEIFQEAHARRELSIQDGDTGTNRYSQMPKEGESR
jgi:hypothetical protein